MSTVGVDLGTSGVRAVAYDEQGKQIAAAAEKTSLKRPREGWVVLDAEALLQSVESLLAAVAKEAVSQGDQVRAIALSSQAGNGCGVWLRKSDAAEAVISPG